MVIEILLSAHGAIFFRIYILKKEAQKRNGQNTCLHKLWKNGMKKYND